MGKQAVDGDTNQVGQLLAEYLDWPQATFAATIEEEEGGLLVGREVDGGVAKLRVKFPAVVTVDLRIVAATSVYSTKTARTFKYNDGVRFAACRRSWPRRRSRSSRTSSPSSPPIRRSRSATDRFEPRLRARRASRSRTSRAREQAQDRSEGPLRRRRRTTDHGERPCHRRSRRGQAEDDPLRHHLRQAGRRHHRGQLLDPPPRRGGRACGRPRAASAPRRCWSPTTPRSETTSRSATHRRSRRWQGLRRGRRGRRAPTARIFCRAPQRGSSAGYAATSPVSLNDGGLKYKRPMFAGNAFGICSISVCHPGRQRPAERLRAGRAHRRRVAGRERRRRRRRSSRGACRVRLARTGQERAPRAR
jgi:hypothetical protein